MSPPIFEVLVRFFEDFMVLYYYFLRLNFFRLFETSSNSLQNLLLCLFNFPAILCIARQRRIGMRSFYSTISLILLVYYIVMQNLACTYPIFMKHNPIFSQKCSDFSVFSPPTGFLRRDLRKFTDRSKI